MTNGFATSSAVIAAASGQRAAPWLVVLALLPAWTAPVQADSTDGLPAAVRNRSDPFARLLEIDQGHIASSWSSLPRFSDCRAADTRLAVHALGLAEPSRAATEQHTGSFDLIDPRYRAQADLGAQAGCVFGQLSVQRQVGADGDFWSMDGSALSWQIGAHWRVGAGLIAHQWGPGCDGSLILGTAARPFANVSVDAVSGVLPRSSFWWWLGEVDLNAFFGQLEADRGDYARPYLMGARLVIRPHPSLQLGVSRTAQWGGEGRDNSRRAFWNALLGRDNQDGANGLAEQPGNQLGGFDARWDLSRWLPGIALYGQMIGEDEAADLPSKYMYQLGASWHLGLTMAFVEWTDSTAGIPGVAYNHHIYTDGYRYRGRPLGHWADGDANVWTLGGLWDGAALGQALAVLRAGKLNDSGASPTWPSAELRAASLQWRRMLDKSFRLTVSADYFRLDIAPGTPAAARQRDTATLRVQLEWWH